MRLPEAGEPPRPQKTRNPGGDRTRTSSRCSPRSRRTSGSCTSSSSKTVAGSGRTPPSTACDVDMEGSRIIARPKVVKGRSGRRKPRWVQVPEWLMQVLLDTCPPEDRLPERPLFPWLRRVQHPIQAANKTMRAAYKVPASRTSIRTIFDIGGSSLWHGQGIPARTIGDRVGQTSDRGHVRHLHPRHAANRGVREGVPQAPDDRLEGRAKWGKDVEGVMLIRAFSRVVWARPREVPVRYRGRPGGRKYLQFS